MPERDDREVVHFTLGRLLEGVVPARLSAELREQPVSGVYDDSRQVRPGGVFVAVPGTTHDGRQFIPEAIRRGARVVIGADLPPGADALRLNVSDVRTVLALLAARWYGLDDAAGRGLRLIGISGTNGKTTTAHMTQAILRAAGRRCGMLGTVQYDLCRRSMTARLTTPGPLELAAYLRQCLDDGAEFVVMEVSSHALDQRRVAGLRFCAAVLTNLSHDHLDYHGSIEAYRAAKARLFAALEPEAVAVVNRDDPHWPEVLRDCRARQVGYGLTSTALEEPSASAGAAPPRRVGRDVTATISRDSLAGTWYRLRVGGHELVLENALVGRHNVYNALAAASVAHALGVSVEAIARGLSSVRNIPGRLQRVPCLPGIEVFVDYAHTEDALRNVAGVLKPLTAGRLIIVFGCGGDRDVLKRPRMAAAAAQFADLIVVTSDNPRTEDPLRIIDDILAGFAPADRARVLVEPDRRRAIRAALARAGPGDAVLIAGKGHEDYQVVGHERLHFDDTEVALEEAAALCAREESLAR